jgi:uncharacterized integral membrane protein
VVIAVLVLIFLLIFIMQNLTGVRVFFLGAAGTLPLGWRCCWPPSPGRCWSR